MGEQSYWISWYATIENGCFNLDWPCWASGSRPADDADMICAAVRAPSEEAAKQIVVDAHDNVPPDDIEWRFCNDRPNGWSPYCDKFPQGEHDPEWPAAKPGGQSDG